MRKSLQSNEEPFLDGKDMKKQSVYIVLMSILLVLIDGMITLAEYAAFMEHATIWNVVTFVFLLAALFFVVRPLVDYHYDKLVRAALEKQLPQKREERMYDLIETLNNAYYEKGYEEEMHLQKTALEKWQKKILAQFEMIKFALHAMAYTVAFLFLYPQLWFEVLILIGVSFSVKYVMAKKNVDYFIVNVAEDQTAEYFRNILFDPVAMREIKSYRFEKVIAEKSVTAFNVGIKKRYRLRQINAIAHPLMKAIILLLEGLVLLSLTGVSHNVGNAVVSMSCIMMVVSCVEPFGEALFRFQEAGTILKEAEEKTVCRKHYCREGIEISSLRSIVFENVSFSYTEDHPILDNISFCWKAGESLSILGDNGAGKTTLIKLLLGINKPTKGRIFINGFPMEQINLTSYLSRLGICLQDYVIFEDSIENNLSMGRTDRTQLFSEERKKLLSFAERLPMGVQTILGNRTSSEGLGVSGGEQQRIALGRALMKEADAYVLDEPTVSMDLHMETVAFELFKSMAEKKSVILITHRMGFAGISGRIIVIHQGKIVEEGSHAELMAANGLYKSMVQTQMQMFEA